MKDELRQSSDLKLIEGPIQIGKDCVCHEFFDIVLDNVIFYFIICHTR